MVLCSLNLEKGLSNRTHLMVLDIKANCLKCQILNGSRGGTIVLLPKIKMLYEEDKKLGISFFQYRFPVTVVFAMTINKSQGQGYEKVGIYFYPTRFSHMGSCVLLCQGQSPQTMYLLVKWLVKTGRPWMLWAVELFKATRSTPVKYCITFIFSSILSLYSLCQKKVIKAGANSDLEIMKKLLQQTVNEIV